MPPEPLISIFLGLDVGSTKHHACALDQKSNKLYDKPLPQLEPDLARNVGDLQRHGQVLDIVGLWVKKCVRSQ